MTATTNTRPTGHRADTGQLACQDPAGPDFTTPDLWEQAEAAAICATCSVAEACRSTARQYDQAHQVGADLYGAYGCWGGWWFQPGKTPHRILPADDEEKRPELFGNHLYDDQPRRAA